jgi:hypothetical protein
VGLIGAGSYQRMLADLPLLIRPASCADRSVGLLRLAACLEIRTFSVQKVAISLKLKMRGPYRDGHPTINTMHGA